MTRNIFAFLLLAVLAPALPGCGGKQDASSASGGASGPAKSPEQAVQNHLNDPNVSEEQKAEIRKHMQGTPASGASSTSGQ